MRCFKAGDIVEVVSDTITKGRQGEVVDPENWQGRVCVSLFPKPSVLGARQTITVYPSSIKKVDREPWLSKELENSDDVLYFLYSEDLPVPKSIGEAGAKWDMSCPLMASTNIKEIINEIQCEARDCPSNNMFVVANNKIYPVTTTISIPGLVEKIS